MASVPFKDPHHNMGSTIPASSDLDAPAGGFTTAAHQEEETHPGDDDRT